MQMENKKLLIVGIDPGTTTGYAVLDLNGKLLEIKSSKNLGLNDLIADILKIGKVVSVGTDKAKVPSLVYLFSAKTGAKILHPKEDLKVDEKRKLTSDFKTKDEHENDALACSLFAFRKIKDILDRINDYAEARNKFSIMEKITDFVLTKDVSIREAVELIEDARKEETKIIKKVVEEKELKQRDFMRLYRIIKRYEKEIHLLKKQNDTLKNRANSLEKKYNNFGRVDSIKLDKKIKNDLLLKEKSIRFLERSIHNKEEEIRNLSLNIRKFNNIFARWDDAVVLKKLDNLGSSEFNKKKDLLNIRKDDILLVDNPNIISNEVMDFLKDKISTIITKMPANDKIKEEHSFLFVSHKDLKIEEDSFFAIASKKEVREILENKATLKSLVESYKKSRKTELLE